MADFSNLGSGRAASTIPVSFRGTAGSYFRLFISNLLLTIVTLGIYSPWARVRTRRYFMGYTYLGEHNIDFDASPLSILVARIIIIVVLVSLSFIETTFDLIWYGIGFSLLALLLLMPIALVRGRAFVARHTIHRTVRFQFRLEYLRSMLMFMGYGLTILPLLYFSFLAEEAGGDEALAYLPQIGLSFLLALFLFPLLISMDHRIQIGQLQFGKLEFRYEGGWMRYYGAYIKAFLWFIPYTIGFNIIAFLLLSGLSIALDLAEETLFVAFTVIGFINGLLFFALLRGALTTLFWDSIRMGEGGRVQSTLIWRQFANILAVNYVLTVLSVGLLYPWARVRAYRYVSEHLTLEPDPSTTQIMAAGDDLSPLAGELSDLSGFDFDFGAV